MHMCANSESKRGDEWLEFSEAVLDHVESYTVPQYGDTGEDLMTNFTSAQVEAHLMSYLSRLGRSSRVGEEKLTCLKIAHVACMLHAKYSEEEANGTNRP